MATVFSKIINGEIPSYKIAENENYFAFLDINPLKRGHTLVVPKKETDYIFDLDDVNFRNKKLKFSPEEFKEIADKISRNVDL